MSWVCTKKPLGGCRFQGRPLSDLSDTSVWCVVLTSTEYSLVMQNFCRAVASSAPTANHQCTPSISISIISILPASGP